MSGARLKTNSCLENELLGASLLLLVLDPQYTVTWKWQLSRCVMQFSRWPAFGCAQTRQLPAAWRLAENTLAWAADDPSDLESLLFCL